MIATASFDGTVVVWQVTDASFRHWDQIASLEGHENEVKSVSWSFDGMFLASCGRDKKIWIWEKLVGGDFECVAMLEGHTQDVKFLKWHASALVLYSCGYDDTVREWKEDNDDWYCSATLTEHKSTVWGIALEPARQRMVTCSDDGSIICWQDGGASGWARLCAADNLHAAGSPIYSLDLDATLGVLATAAGDNAVAFTDMSSPDLSSTVRFENCHEADINCVRWCPADSGKKAVRLVTAGDDNVAKLWLYSN